MDDDPRTPGSPASGADATGTDRADQGGQAVPAAPAAPAGAGTNAAGSGRTETPGPDAPGPDAPGPETPGPDPGIDAAVDPVVDPLAAVPPALDPLWMVLKDEVSDRVPDDVRGAARSSLGWRDPDSALAALIADSATDEKQLAYVRGATLSGLPRLLTFAAEHLTIEVEVTTIGVPGAVATVNLVGQLVPPGARSVAVDHSAGTVDVPADTMGRFQATGLGPGPLRLRCGPETADAIRTDWFLP
jgi:hypothetical protein